MGKHSKPVPAQTASPEPVTGQDLADSFDRQHDDSTSRAQVKQQAGLPPYHVDHRIKK